MHLLESLGVLLLTEKTDFPTPSFTSSEIRTLLIWLNPKKGTSFVAETSHIGHYRKKPPPHPPSWESSFQYGAGVCVLCVLVTIYDNC